jgi:2-methylisocitrate lyase-like PEP mutase family enzyme
MNGETMNVNEGADNTAARLRREIADDAPLMLLGVGTALEAVIAQAVGAHAIYISGYATAGWVYAKPDIGLIALEEIAANASRICPRVDIPVIVDGDTGYGDAVQVYETVRRLEASGAAGIQLEDQTWPKKCGHMGGKEVITLDAMARKLDAAVRARREETVIVARTDAIAPESLESAIERCNAYAMRGADVLFVDAPESREQLQIIGREVDAPLLVNMSETGKTPILGASELHQLGFDVVLYPTTGIRIAERAIAEGFREILETGSSIDLVDRFASLAELNDMVGLTELERLEAELTTAVTA